jgi:hypothetical protein
VFRFAPALLQVADDLLESSVVSDAAWAVLSKTYSTDAFTVASTTSYREPLISFGVPPYDFLPGSGPYLAFWVRRGPPKAEVMSSNLVGSAIYFNKLDTSLWKRFSAKVAHR